MKPKHYFKTLAEYKELKKEPYKIEFLRIETGETFIHILGTVFWNDASQQLSLEYMVMSKITHWRVIEE